jgi:hypothetical protein
MRFIWGPLVVIIGFLIIKYTYQIVQTFGTINWAEAHLGGGLGGTYTMWKLVGIFVIILGFLYTFGNFGILVNPLAPLFGG